MEFLATSAEKAGYTVLAISGEADVYGAPGLRSRIGDLFDSGHRRLVVDLSEVEFIDSTGLSVLVASQNRVREIGGVLTVVCSQERLLRLFRITGLDQVFTICPTVDEALADPTTA
jgi:anti-sigma B factor antagonist